MVVQDLQKLLLIEELKDLIAPVVEVVEHMIMLMPPLMVATVVLVL